MRTTVKYFSEQGSSPDLFCGDPEDQSIWFVHRISCGQFSLDTIIFNLKFKMISNRTIYDKRIIWIDPPDPHKEDSERILVLFLMALLKPEKAFVIRKWWLSFEQTKRIVVIFRSKSLRQKRNIGFYLGKASRTQECSFSRLSCQ